MSVVQAVITSPSIMLHVAVSGFYCKQVFRPRLFHDVAHMSYKSFRKCPYAHVGHVLNTTSNFIQHRAGILVAKIVQWGDQVALWCCRGQIGSTCPYRGKFLAFLQLQSCFQWLFISCDDKFQSCWKWPLPGRQCCLL